ncbi:MAG TPA: alpha/beta fold hydrolase [Burkholderiales bacterium]|nr:alpha/beta fold hydrolase [Burkholderiales bacterium]
MTPVMLLHASASSSAQWRSLCAALEAKHHVVAPDLVGYGTTPPWQGTGAFRLADEAVQLRRLIRQLGEPVHLVGHSYGGAVALHVARTSPELVRRLVLIEPVAFHLLRDGDAIDLEGLREFSAAAQRVRAAPDPQAAARVFVDYWNGAGAWDRTPPEKRKPVVAALPKLRLELDAALGEPATLADLKALRPPVLLLQGGLTQLSTRCVCHRLARSLPDVALHVVRGAGHMLPLTHRDEVNALVASFIGTEVPRSAARAADAWRRVA